MWKSDFELHFLRTFAQELSPDTSFGMFAPSNKVEEKEFMNQLEDKILNDIKKKHSRGYAKM
jgi:hypothetical protein